MDVPPELCTSSGTLQTPPILFAYFTRLLPAKGHVRYPLLVEDRMAALNPVDPDSRIR